MNILKMVIFIERFPWSYFKAIFTISFTCSEVIPKKVEISLDVVIPKKVEVSLDVLFVFYDQIMP